MVDVSALVQCPLFAGLAPSELELISGRARPRRFVSGQTVCRGGETGDRCWVITGGLLDVLRPSGAAAAGEVVARRRKGAAVGELAAILGEPQPETVIASIPTTVLEFGAEELGELVRQFPQILFNVLRGAHGRLAHEPARSAERQLGETVAVAAGPSLRRLVAGIVTAARSASPRSVTALDRNFSFAGAVTAADDLASSHATVLLPVELDTESVSVLLREADRVVAIAGTAGEVAELGAVQRPPGLRADVEVVLVGSEARQASGTWSPEAPLRTIRSFDPAAGLSLSTRDLGWLGRHVTRTKLGLALGAGGAKGYAHVGVLQVLEEAGYVVDYVAGSSIGAIVGSILALGSSAVEIDQTLRRAFDPATVAEIFKTSLSGQSTGLERMKQLLRETTQDRTFAQTAIPFTAMAVDLSERAPAALRSGLLWEALLAATALAGVFPPHEREGHRLVDGLALVPVPTGAVIQDGADVTVSVNLLGRETLARWPGGPPPEPPPQRRRRGVLDNLLEVMDLSQLEDSARHAELADVVITPQFGPGAWRDFHLADQFLGAGRTAAQAQLPALRALAAPASTPVNQTIEGASIDRADPIRV